MSSPAADNRSRVQQLLEEELARVDSPEAAEEVVRRLEGMAEGRTMGDAADAATSAPAPAPTQVAQAAQAAPPQPEAEAAAVIVETAAQVVAPTPEAPAVRQAARDVLAAPPEAVPPAARRGRSLLKEAMLRRLGPFQALDTRIFLAINCAPHPRWLDVLANAITVLTTGGWLWVFGVLGAYLLRVRKSWQALETLLPSMVLATWIVEHPVKGYFRRKRPFIAIVRALVVGKQPGSWSFPSGHTASSFGCAWILSTIWPRRAPIFFALASCVGLSRVYVGAHYPGDVSVGALLGVGLSEVFRRGVRKVLKLR